MEKSAAGCGTVVGEPAHGALGGGGKGNGGSKGSGQEGPGKARCKKNPKPVAGASKRGPGEGRSGCGEQAISIQEREQSEQAEATTCMLQELSAAC